MTGHQDTTLSPHIKNSSTAATQHEKTPLSAHIKDFAISATQHDRTPLSGHIKDYAERALCSMSDYAAERDYTGCQDTRTPLSGHIKDCATAVTQHDRAPGHHSLLISKIHQLPPLSMTEHHSPLIKIW